MTVPLITDDELAKEFNTKTDEQGRLSSVVLGNDGRVLDVVRQLPAHDHVAAILLALERLAVEFPNRFEVLPEHDHDPEAIDDPTGTQTPNSPSLRQRLNWLTGDRDNEAKALADAVVPNGTPGSVLAAAKRAVHDAHGDSSVAEHDPITSDVASPDDVIDKLEGFPRKI